MRCVFPVAALLVAGLALSCATGLFSTEEPIEESLFSGLNRSCRNPYGR
jgi:hypothetical protein